jgi:hypothetical protein
VCGWTNQVDRAMRGRACVRKILWEARVEHDTDCAKLLTWPVRVCLSALQVSVFRVLLLDTCT